MCQCGGCAYGVMCQCGGCAYGVMCQCGECALRCVVPVVGCVDLTSPHNCLLYSIVSNMDTFLLFCTSSSVHQFTTLSYSIV